MVNSSFIIPDNLTNPNRVKYNGTPALSILFFLVSLSIPWIRTRFYELFAYSHIFAAIAYLGLIFWHAGNLGDSVCTPVPSPQRSFGP